LSSDDVEAFELVEERDGVRAYRRLIVGIAEIDEVTCRSWREDSGPFFVAVLGFEYVVCSCLYSQGNRLVEFDFKGVKAGRVAITSFRVTERECTSDAQDEQPCTAAF